MWYIALRLIFKKELLYVFVMEMNELVHLHLDYEAPQMQEVAMMPRGVILLSGDDNEEVGEGPDFGG